MKPPSKEPMKNHALLIKFTKDGKLVADLVTDKGVKTVEYQPPKPDEDFLVSCYMALEELTKPQGYEGITVCTKSDCPDFTVGTVYEWKGGFTKSNSGRVMPSNRPLERLDEITNPNLHFAPLVWR